jgi:hypothetical protein
LIAPYGGHLAAAAVRLMKQHKPDDWQKLCNIIHGVPGKMMENYGKPDTAEFDTREVSTLAFSRIRPWFHWYPEIANDPEKAVLLYLTSNRWMTDPPDWPDTIPLVNVLLETLFSATQTGEITIYIGIGAETADLPCGRLCKKRLGMNTWHLPFDLAGDQVECNGQKYDVVNIVFPAETPDPQAAEPAAPKDNGFPHRPALAKEWQTKYNQRVTKDHAPTRKEDVIWAKAEGISQKRLWRLRSDNPDKRLHTIGPPRKGATSTP